MKNLFLLFVTHTCRSCLLNDISNQWLCDCHELAEKTKNHSDTELKFSILSKEEWLYLKAVITPFRNRIKNIEINNDMIYINPNCSLIKCFDFDNVMKIDHIL